MYEICLDAIDVDRRRNITAQRNWEAVVVAQRIEGVGDKQCAVGLVIKHVINIYRQFSPGSINVRL